MNKTKYLKEWREKNIEKLRKYNREWMRRHRKPKPLRPYCKKCGVRHYKKGSH